MCMCVGWVGAGARPDSSTERRRGGEIMDNGLVYKCFVVVCVM